jgi:hypothetical protein
MDTSRKPGVLVLTALPTELNINKNNKELWKIKDDGQIDWSIKENIDNLTSNIKQHVDPECKTDLHIKFTSVGGDNMVSSFLKQYYELKSESGGTIDYVINVGSVGIVVENLDDKSKIGQLFQCTKTMTPELNYIPGNEKAGTNINEMNLHHDNSAFHNVECNAQITLPFEKATCYSSNTFPFANDTESWLNKEDKNIAILDQEMGFLNRAMQNSNLPCNLISIKYGTNLVTQDDLKKDPKTCSKQSASEWIQDLWGSTNCQEKLLNGLKFTINAIGLQNKSFNSK